MVQEIASASGDKSVMIDKTFTLLQKYGDMLLSSLESLNLDTKILGASSGLIKTLLAVSSDAAKVANADVFTNEGKAILAGASVSLIKNSASLINEISQMANSKSNVLNLLASTLSLHEEKLTNTAISIASTQEPKELASASFALVGEVGEMVHEMVVGLGVNEAKSATGLEISKAILGISSSISQIAMSDDKSYIADMATDIVLNANELVSSSLKMANISDEVSKLAHDNISEILPKAKELAISIAGANTNSQEGRAKLAKDSLDLINQGTNALINTLKGVSGLNQKDVSFAFDFSNSFIKMTKDITDLLVSKNSSDYVNSSLNITSNAADMIKLISEFAGDSSGISQAVTKELQDFIGLAKEDMLNIASLANSKDYDGLVLASLKLSQKANGLLSNIVSIKDQDAASAIENIGNSLINTAVSVSELVGQNSPKNIASLSVKLAGNANEVLNSILLAFKANNKVSDAAYANINSSLPDIQNLAITIASANANSTKGKAEIAKGSLELISKSGQIINAILKDSGLNNEISDGALKLSNTLLMTASGVTDLVMAAKPEDSAAAIVGLVSNTNELVDDILKLSNMQTGLSSAAHNSIAKGIPEIKALAKSLATASNEYQIAQDSLSIISKANQIVSQILQEANLSSKESVAAQKLGDSVLDGAKILTRLLSVDASSDEGKIAITSASLDLAKSTSVIINDVLELSGVKNELSTKIGSVAGNILEQSKTSLLEIAKIAINIANADPLSSKGTNEIVLGSISIAKQTNDFITGVIGSISPEHAGASGIGSNLFDIAKSIATLIQVDPNSIEGKAAIATGSLNLISDTNTFVRDVLNVAKASTPITELVSGSITGVLGSVSGLVGSAIKLSKWDSMSSSEQLAAGFDVGLKSFSAATGIVSSVGEAVESFMGVSSIIPEVSGALSAAALAVSPIEIKGLADEYDYVKQLRGLGEQSEGYGYIGDSMLADLMGEKFALNTAYTATNIALNIAATAVSAAAMASVVGAPAAAIAGVVKGVVSGILAALKQPSLEIIAARYAQQIKEYSDVNGFFELNTKASLEKFYNNDEVKEYMASLQKSYGADMVISLDGVSLSKTAIDLAASTKLSEQINKANNYATLLRDGKIDSEAGAKYLSMNQETGVLNISTNQNSIVKFNTPLFAPGVENSNREKVGKNNYYTKLILDAKDRHTINDADGSNIFISNDKYASYLYNSNGDLIKTISLDINAGGGDDTYIADSSHVKFDGGDGIDSISYNNASINGIVVHARENGYVVQKSIKDADVTIESIATSTTQYGKRTEKVEYRDLNIEKKSFEASDILKNVEIISASDANDVLNGGDGADVFLGQKGNDSLYGNGGNDKLYGGAGDDIIAGGAGVNQLYGGAGDDVYILEIGANDFIRDSEGLNMLQISSYGLKGLSLELDKNGADATINIKKNLQNISSVNIQDANKFGIISVDKGYFFDIKSAGFKYITAGDAASVDFQTNELNFNQDAQLHIYAGAKQNELNLSSTHENLISIFKDTSSNIRGFLTGKDKLLTSPLDQKATFSGYDSDGADVSIDLAGTHVVLVGAGSSSHSGLNDDDLAKIFLA